MIQIAIRSRVKEKNTMEKIWLSSYPKGVPAEINPYTYQSLVELLEDSCTKYQESPALYSMGVTLNYQTVLNYSKIFAAYLQQSLGLKKGDRIALMMPNILQYPIAMFGALLAGLTVVNVNPLYTVPELIHQMEDSGAETIVVLENFADIVEQALPKTALKKVIVTRIGDFLPRFKAMLIHAYLKYIQKKIPAIHMPIISFKKAMHDGKALSLNRVPLSLEDIAFLQYTGGTTGIAKGAMLTHKNLIANILQAEVWFSPILKENKEIMITALPLYHIFSLMANCFFLTKIGGFSILIANPRDTKHMIAEMAKFKWTTITGVNTLFNALLKQSSFAALDFSAVKISIGGGMAVQRSVAEKWQTVTGKVLLEAYGLTETSPCVTINPADIKVYNGTIGLPVPSTEVAILDDNGQELPLNQPGELAVKGPQVMKGYWNNPAETARVFTSNGWLLTGDIGKLDEKGYVTLLERKKEMILVSGFNVYPNEVEEVIMTLPGVREVAVVGVPNSESGEAVKAFIVKDNPELTEAAVRQFCRENLTGYKVPHYIEFRDVLPKSNVGKILRRALR